MNDCRFHKMTAHFAHSRFIVAVEHLKTLLLVGCMAYWGLGHQRLDGWWSFSWLVVGWMPGYLCLVSWLLVVTWFGDGTQLMGAVVLVLYYYWLQNGNVVIIVIIIVLFVLLPLIRHLLLYIFVYKQTVIFCVSISVVFFGSCLFTRDKCGSLRFHLRARKIFINNDDGNQQHDGNNNNNNKKNIFFMLLLQQLTITTIIVNNSK